MKWQDIMSKKDLDRWNVDSKSMNKIVEELKKNKPDIEDPKEFKKSLEALLKERAKSMKGNKKNRKIVKFSKFTKYATLGAAALLVIVIGVPNIIKNRPWEKDIHQLINLKSDKSAVLSSRASYSSSSAPSTSKKLKSSSTETKMEAPSFSGSIETDWGADLELVEEEILLSYDQDNLIIDTMDDFSTEEYKRINENPFLKVMDKPLSTFSIDVDTASYANVRRFINQGSLPPKDSVRVEEMINYFNYDYPLPKKDKPFSINTEVSECPWNRENLLVHIGLQGRDIPKAKLPPSNLVFLIDVSGSMDSPNKLGLLVNSVELMLDQFTRKDRVSIVAYAGAAGVVLPSTAGNKREVILDAFKRLSAGGSTAGGEGIELAYKIAMDNFIPNGNNRVIIATDGDFNVGVSSTGDLTRLIEEKRDSGVFLTVLGFGMGNYKDSRMESLANTGNGNYAYIDSLLEAQKVLVDDIKKTLFVIAKDVKIQVEFNPAVVKEYRLVGYETRLLRDRDFNDDKIDAGDIGSGHTVTALYEVVLKPESDGAENSLKYQDKTINNRAKTSGELLSLSLRYKEPDEDESKLIEEVVSKDFVSLKKSSNNFKFSAAVAGYAQILRGSEHIEDYDMDDVISLTKESLGDDSYGYRSEFYTLLRKVKLLK